LKCYYRGATPKMKNYLNFSIKRKSGTIRDSECPNVFPDLNKCLDVPSAGSVKLVDDIEQVIVSIVPGILPFSYKVEDYPVSHHVKIKEI